MKQIFTFLIASVLSIAVLNAQFPVSKNGHDILPKQGDIAFAVGAAPFLSYVSNLVKINSGSEITTTPHYELINNRYVLKYYTGDKTAIRAKANVSFNSTTTVNEVPDAANANEFVDNKTTESYSELAVSLGIERRRGENRLQGFYGAEATIYLGSGDATNPNMKYKYGNPVVAQRLLKETQGATLGIGGGVFIGAEYFFTPKIAFGGELNLNLIIQTNGKGKTVYEEADGSETETSTGSSVTTLSLGQASGVYDFANVYVIFHF